MRLRSLLLLFPAALPAACVVLPLEPPHPMVYAPPVMAAPAPSSTTWSVRLYPLNDNANQAGMLSAVVIDHQGGRGSFSVNYRGETLQGEATRSAGSKGVAYAFSPRGVHVQCDYSITGSRRGIGSCQFSDGALYRMHFNE